MEKKRIILNVVFISIILIILSIIPNIFYTINLRKNDNQEFKNNIINEAKYNSEIIENELQNNVNELNMLAEFVQSICIDRMNIDYGKDKFENLKSIPIQKMFSFVAEKNNFSQILFADVTGKVYIDSQKNTNLSISNLKAFKKAMNGETVFDEFVEDENGDLLLCFAIPFSLNNKFEGVVLATKSLKNISSLLKEDFYNGNGYNIVVDNEGNVLFYSNNLSQETLIKNKQSFSDLELNLLKDKLSNVGLDVVQTTNNSIAFSKIGFNSKWYVISSISSKFANNRIINLQDGIDVFLIIFIISFIILIFSFIYICLKKSEKFNRFIFYDEITGIRNEAKFVIDTEQVLKKDKNNKYAIMIFDIDNFEYISNVYGFEERNIILKNVSNVLKQNLAKDEIFARIKNNYFVILSKYLSDSIIEKKMQRLIYCFKKQQKIDAIYTILNFPCGVYKISEYDSIADLNSMIEKAIMAQKYIKGQNKSDCFFYTEEMQQKVISDSELENKMQISLEKEEFVLYIQPKYELQTLKIVGGEALIRWHSSSRGFMLPKDFIPLFEKNGFILKLDIFVFETVCKKLREWLNKGYKILPISINQSILNINNKRYISDISSILNKYNIQPKYIEIEFNESLFLNDKEVVSRFIDKLRKIGIRIIIDNFGQQMSSLNILQDFNVNTLKIDKNLIDNVPENKKACVIVKNIFNIAKELRIKIIATGVETMNQFEFLESIECEIVQGFLYSKCISFDDFETNVFSETGLY